MSSTKTRTAAAWVCARPGRPQLIAGLVLSVLILVGLFTAARTLIGFGAPATAAPVVTAPPASGPVHAPPLITPPGMPSVPEVVLTDDELAVARVAPLVVTSWIAGDTDLGGRGNEALLARLGALNAPPVGTVVLGVPTVDVDSVDATAAVPVVGGTVLVTLTGSDLGWIATDLLWEPL